MIDTEKFHEALSKGKVEDTKQLVRAALDEGQSARDVLDRGLMAALDRIGEKFTKGELFVPHVLIAARAMHAGMAILKPMLMQSGAPRAGKIVIGTVKGDMHDIGKNIVAMMLEGAGFEMVDLGVDVSAKKFVEATREQQPQVVAMSCLLTTTMPEMKTVIDALAEHGLRTQVKVVIGGAPLRQEYAATIGADGFAQDAAAAVTLVRSLLRNQPVATN